MDNNLKRAIILDNYEHPYNRGLVTNEDYDNINANNESCIDNFDMDIKIENNIIKDMHFDGEGCAISTSSTSIMLQMFIDEKEYDSNILEEAVVYNDIYKQPSRKKCALLSYVSLKKYLLSRKDK